MARHAARTLRPDVEPAVGMHLHYARGGLEMARGRHADAIAAFRAARQLAETLRLPHFLTTPMRAHAAGPRAARRNGAGSTLPRRAGPSQSPRVARYATPSRCYGWSSTIRWGRRPRWRPSWSGSVRVHPVWVVAAALLEAIARDELGDPAAAERAIERALDLAEPDLVLFPFLTHPVPALLERHARDCAKHAALVAEILSLLPRALGVWGAGAAPPGSGGSWGDQGSPPRLVEPPPAGRAAEPGRDPGAALSADQLVGSGDRPRAVGVGEHGPHAHPPRVRQAGRARSNGGGNAGPRPRPARTVSPVRPEVPRSGHPHQQDRLTGPERTGSPFAG